MSLFLENLSFLDFVDPVIAILPELKNYQNGTFEHVHEIQKIFLLKDIFWSKVPQVQDLCQKAEIFSKKIH